LLRGGVESFGEGSEIQGFIKKSMIAIEWSEKDKHTSGDVGKVLWLRLSTTQKSIENLSGQSGRGSISDHISRK
jgi:hypothetical protein